MSSPQKIPALVEGSELTLRPDDRLVDAAYRVLRRHFVRMVWNESGTREGTDPARLHDMRVATRRLRAALGVFQSALGASRVKPLREPLRRIGRTLGAVRDLDVQLARLGADARSGPSLSRGHARDALGESIGLYRAFLEARRNEARLAMLRELSDGRRLDFMKRFRRFLDAGAPKRPSAGGRRAAAEEGARIVRKRLKKALEGGRNLTRRSTDAELHAQRIRLKRLRYACEFFADLLGPEGVKFTTRVVELQDALGDQHDAVVGRETLSGIARGLRAPARLRRRVFLMLGHLAAQAARRERAARETFAKLWKRFDRKRTRRALATALKSCLDCPPTK